MPEIRAGELASRLWDAMEHPPSTPEYWAGPVMTDTWQAGYRWGLSRAREEIAAMCVELREAGR